MTRLVGLERRDIHNHGTKAVNLGLLSKAGLAIPAGYSLSAEVQRTAIDAVHSSRQPGSICSRLEAVREAIAQFPLGPSVEDDVRRAWTELAGLDGIAVRS